MKEGPAQGHTEVSGILPHFLPGLVLIICKLPYHPLLGPFYQMSQTEGLKAHFSIVFSKAQQSNHHPQPPLRGHLEAALWHCIVLAQGGYVVWPEVSLKSVISLLQTAGASVNSDTESHSSPGLVNRKREGKPSQHPESVPGWKTFPRGTTAAGGGRPGVHCSWVLFSLPYCRACGSGQYGAGWKP